MLASSTGAQADAANMRAGSPTMLVVKRNRRIMFAASAGLFQRILQIGSTLILMPQLLRVLGPTQFGIWGAAVSLAWLSGFVDFGTGAALVTLVARASARETGDEARRYVTGALGLGSGLTLFMLSGVVIIPLIGVPQGQIESYLIIIVGLALNVPLSSANNVWLALQKAYVSSAWESVQALLTLAGLLAAMFFRRDLRDYIVVVYAALVLANMGSLVHLLVAHPHLRPNRAAMSVNAMREVGRQGSMYFVLGIAGGLSFFLDNVLALKLVGPEASARMTIAMRICMTGVGMLVALSQPLWPAFAEAAERQDRYWIRRGVLRGMAVLGGLTFGSSVILVVWGERLLHWWLHTNLGIDKGFLIAIAAWIIAQALSRVPNLLLNGLSIVRFQMIVYSIAATFAFGLKFSLAQRFGVSGILWGTTAAMLVLVIPASIWRIRCLAKASNRVIPSLGADFLCSNHGLNDSNFQILNTKSIAGRQHTRTVRTGIGKQS